MNFIERISDYSNKAISTLKNTLNVNDLIFDHICYQTKDKEDYYRAINELKKYIVPICELSHAGRYITVARLKSSIKIEGIEINKIEISEPKPKGKFDKRHFDHIAFVVKNDLNDYLNYLKTKGVDIYEIKQIREDKIVKIKIGSIRYELRDKKLGEDINEKNPDDYDNQIKKLEEELKLERERKLRALADYQNLLKRIDKEREEYTLLANISILKEILDVLDDFNRMIDKIKLNENDELGLKLINEKLQKIVNNFGIEEIECGIGDKFDHNKFEAIGIVAVSNKDENDTVREIVQKGYKIKGRDIVVRPVRVIIGKKK